MNSVPKERDEQVKLVKWLQLKRIPHFAVPNGGSRNMVEATRMKAEGVVAGVSDVVVFTKHKILFVEMKRQKRKLKNGKLSTSHCKVSDAQKQFIAMLDGYDYAEGRVCYGFDEATSFILEHTN